MVSVLDEIGSGGASLNKVGAEISSGTWGNETFPVTQAFGVPGFRSDWYQYSAGYGWPAGYHIGLDVGMPKGTPIFATQDGTVERAGFNESFRPNPVYIRERDGDLAIYGHLWENTVTTGDPVKKGQLIGFSGEQTIRGTMTPDGSGPHLHYELISSSGVAKNPIDELSGQFNTFGTSTSGGLPLIGDVDWQTLSLRGAAIVGGGLVIILAFLRLRGQTVRSLFKGK